MAKYETFKLYSSKTLQLKIFSSPAQLLHPVLEAGTILYEVGNRAATQGFIEHLQQDFIKEGEEQIFHLQGYELRHCSN